MFKKIFTISFIVIFVIVFVLITVIVTRKIFFAVSPFSAQEITITDASFTCPTYDPVASRAYIFVRGFGDHDIKAFDFQRELISTDKKTVGSIDFDYDETKTLEELTDDFVSTFETFARENAADEIIIIAESAGGTIASNAAHRLDFENRIELHTLASPLRGYNVPASFLGDKMIGFEKDIAMGIDDFHEPNKNMVATHHKTVTDQILQDACGAFASFCDPLDVQNNNLKGSEIFFYPNEDHSSIVETVSEMVIACKK